MSKSPRYFIQIPVKNAERTDINSTDKLVFGEIHTMLNGNKYFFMSSKKLGECIGTTSRTVIRSIKKLNRLNYIDVKFDTHDSKNHKRYICHDRACGNDDMSVPGTPKNVSTGDDKISKGTAQNVSTGTPQNVTVLDKLNRLHNKSVKDIPRNKFEKDFQKVDKFVQKKWVADIPSNRKLFIDRLVTKYGYKSVIDAMTIAYNNAIGIMGMPKYTAAVLKNNQHKPKGRHRNSYGRPIIKQKLPKWAKKGYKPKLHPTGKKLQETVRKSLAKLNHRGDKK